MERFESTDILRKYMSLPKLIFLLKNKKLFFRKAVKTKCYKDVLFDLEDTKYCFFYGNIELIHELNSNYDISKISNIDEISEFIFINSWNKSESESQAMWGCFKKESECLVIQTNLDRIIKSISPEILIDTNIVKYIYTDGVCLPMMPNRDYIYPFFVKDISSEFENEFRIIISTFNNANTGLKIETLKNEEGTTMGLYVDTDLSILIEKIILPPKTESYILETQICLIQKYLPDCKIVTSSLEKTKVENENIQI